MIFVAAVAEFLISFRYASIPTTDSPYAMSASPKGLKLSPKSSRSLLPTISPSQPPLFGTRSAISMIFVAAVAEASMSSRYLSMPTTDSPYVIRALPKSPSPAAKSARSLVPVKKSNTLPISPSSFMTAITPVIALIAAAEAFTASTLIPETLSANTLT